VGGHPRVVAVGLDRDCPAADIAANASLPTFRERLADYPDRGAWDAALTEATAAHSPDLVVSAGFMKILGPQFLSKFEGRTLNTHPALLPYKFLIVGHTESGGRRDHNVAISQRRADAVRDTLVTMFKISPPVLDDDNEQTLHERIKVVERRLLVDVIAAVATGGVTWIGRKATIG